MMDGRSASPRSLRPAMFFVTLTVAWAACNDTTEPAPPAPVADVTVEPDSAAIRVGHTLQMGVTSRDAAGNVLTDRAVNWSVSDDAIVTVSSTGVATGLVPGNVRITATVEDVSDSTLLTVLIPVSRTRVLPDTVTLVPGGSFQVRAEVTGPNGEVLSGRPLEWSSSDPAVATVSANGIVTAGVPGQALVEATSEGAGGTMARIVVGTATFASIGGGSAARHTCAVTADGATYCWGDNSSGQLGNGTSGFESDSNAMLTHPTGIVSIRQVVSVHTGDIFACAVTSAHSYCWGSNAEARLGDGTLDRRLTPVPLATGVPLFVATAGFEHACALTTDSMPYCWGGSPGAPLAPATSFPRPVPNSPAMRALAAGRDFTCAVGTDSPTYCWGLGPLGSSQTSSESPVLVDGDLAAISVAAGFRHACAIGVDSLAYCWGLNESGQLGSGDTQERSAPAVVTGGAMYGAITAGEDFTCALTATGAAECWGSNASGQLGRSTTEACNGRACATTPGPVDGGHAFSQLAAGAQHVCGLATSGVTHCWGLNESGQLGDGTTVNRALPTRVQGQP